MAPPNKNILAGEITMKTDMNNNTLIMNQYNRALQLQFYQKMRISPQLIQNCPQYTNNLGERQLDLRGKQIRIIENLSSTLDFYECIDLSDNSINKLFNFPYLEKIKTLVFANNSINKLTDCSEYIPNLKHLNLMSNKLTDITEIANLASFSKLERLVLINNMICQKPNYRLYVIGKIPSLKVLDFKAITTKQREQANQYVLSLQQ